jgi:hypothetical protein
VECTFVRCVIALSPRECIEKCGRGADLIEGISGRGVTLGCGARGSCKVECEERRDQRAGFTTERWRASPATPTPA